MKKVLVISVLSLFILVAGFVSATSCTPDSGYDYCDYHTITKSYGNAQAVAMAEIQITNLRYDGSKRYINYKAEGDKLYLYLNSIDLISTSDCSRDGCKNYAQVLPMQGTYEVVNNDCIMFLAYDYEYDSANDGSSAWVYAFQGRGWAGTGNCFICIENWDCSAWGPCISGIQTRTCNDLHNCGTTLIKPPLLRACTCTPSWQTGSWSTCTSGTQTRTVTDSNNCGTTEGKPATTQTCTVTCTPDNSCQANTCIGSTCTNNCGTVLQGTKDCSTTTQWYLQEILKLGDFSVKLWMLIAVGGAALLIILLKKK